MGSSPRGRGKPSPRRTQCTSFGLIPAWAGKTQWKTRIAECVSAHPRVGGENPRLPLRRRAVARLIPAWAGKTRHGQGWHVRRRAHPRVGGENHGQVCAWAEDVGSSPRGRGKPHARRSPRDRRRLIPAWAGKTHCLSPSEVRGAAHPRVGGENMPMKTVVTNGSGSSPRGRGKHADEDSRHEGIGLIPAWAGKTVEAGEGWVGSGAHPRVGGENASARRRCSSRAGSSPRGRGKRIPETLSPVGAGLIPAWAGKTLTLRG